MSFRQHSFSHAVGACTLLALATFASSASAQTNLIANGNAEAGAALPDGSVVSVPSWTTTAGNFTAVRYSADYGFPNFLSPGPADRGMNFFAGGPDIAFSAATQLITLSASDAAGAAAGVASYALSGWFGGFSSQNDYATLTATFLSGSGMALNAFSIGSVGAGVRESESGLLYREGSFSVPTGTTQVLLTLSMTRLDGSYDDGYADNLSFSVSGGIPGAGPSPVVAVPEPQTYALMLGGLAAVAGLARRRALRINSSTTGKGV